MFLPSVVLDAAPLFMAMQACLAILLISQPSPWVESIKHVCCPADLYQGMRVIVITLQKATDGPGPADWDKLFLN